MDDYSANIMSFMWQPDGVIEANGMGPVRARVLVDVDSGEIYVAVEPSWGTLGQSPPREWYLPAGTYRLNEVVTAEIYRAVFDEARGPSLWICRRVDRLPESCVPVQTRYRRPSHWRELPD
jgi:hypothetical protein